MSMRSPAREKGGSSALTMTTAAFLLRMSCGSNGDAEARQPGRKGTSAAGDEGGIALSVEPGHEPQAQDLVAPDAAHAWQCP